ncbi:MAG: NifU family protein [Rhodospirillales bacterium]
MFIQTETTSNPATLKFLPGKAVMPAGSAAFANAEKAEKSPLAKRLFEIDGVIRVLLETDSISVKKADDKDWDVLKPAILGAVMDHYTSGDPVIVSDKDAGDDAPDHDGKDVKTRIQDLIETRIRPATSQGGGDVVFHEFKDGIVYLEMLGSAAGLRAGIENMLRHYIPEVQGVKDYRDALPKPGLETPVATAVQKVLDEKVNPAVASHGGSISLIDVQESTAYIRLEGGCQGCGMATATLKQGVEKEILAAVPEITAVLDTTDHASGANPYYSPA